MSNTSSAELKEIIENRERKAERKLKREENAKKKELKKQPTPKQLADEFTAEAIETIKKAIKKGETSWGFKGGKDYLIELKKNLEGFGFKSISLNHDDGFTASDPDGGWLDYDAFDFIVIKFEYSWQIDDKTKIKLKIK